MERYECIPFFKRKEIYTINGIDWNQKKILLLRRAVDIFESDFEVLDEMLSYGKEVEKDVLFIEGMGENKLNSWTDFSTQLYYPYSKITYEGLPNVSFDFPLDGEQAKRSLVYQIASDSDSVYVCKELLKTYIKKVKRYHDWVTRYPI